MPIQDAIDRLKFLDETEGYIRDTQMWAVADVVDWVEKTLIGGYTPVAQVAPPVTPDPVAAPVNAKVEGSSLT